MRLNHIVENFYQIEKVKTGRLFFRYLKLKNLDVEREGIVVYSYLRWLDDFVDSGINPHIASDILDQEERIIKGVMQGEKFETESYQYLVENLNSQKNSQS